MMILLGKPVSEYMKMCNDPALQNDVVLMKLKNKLSDLCVRTLVKMIFFDNFIHGDLHPGIYIYVIVILYMCI